MTYKRQLCQNSYLKKYKKDAIVIDFQFNLGLNTKVSFVINLINSSFEKGPIRI